MKGNQRTGQIHKDCNCKIFMHAYWYVFLNANTNAQIGNAKYIFVPFKDQVIQHSEQGFGFFLFVFVFVFVFF
jgi:hypothetical protein